MGIAVYLYIALPTPTCTYRTVPYTVPYRTVRCRIVHAHASYHIPGPQVVCSRRWRRMRYEFRLGRTRGAPRSTRKPTANRVSRSRKWPHSRGRVLRPTLSVRRGPAVGLCTLRRRRRRRPPPSSSCDKRFAPCISRRTTLCPYIVYYTQFHFYNLPAANFRIGRRVRHRNAVG